jgi:hypothetical protein
MGVTDYYGIDLNTYQFIHEKDYREKKIKYVNNNNYLQKFDTQKHGRYNLLEMAEDINKDEIQAVLHPENLERNNNDNNNNDIDNSVTVVDNEIPPVVDCSLNGLMNLRKRAIQVVKVKDKDDFSSREEGEVMLIHKQTQLKIVIETAMRAMKMKLKKLVK